MGRPARQHVAGAPSSDCCGAAAVLRCCCRVAVPLPCCESSTAASSPLLPSPVRLPEARHSQQPAHIRANTTTRAATGATLEEIFHNTGGDLPQLSPSTAPASADTCNPSGGSIKIDCVRRGRRESSGSVCVFSQLEGTANISERRLLAWLMMRSCDFTVEL